MSLLCSFIYFSNNQVYAKVIDLKTCDPVEIYKPMYCYDSAGKLIPRHILVNKKNGPVNRLRQRN